MTQDQIVTRITNGSANMPAYTRILRPTRCRRWRSSSPGGGSGQPSGVPAVQERAIRRRLPQRPAPPQRGPPRELLRPQRDSRRVPRPPALPPHRALPWPASRWGSVSTAAISSAVDRALVQRLRSGRPSGSSPSTAPRRTSIPAPSRRSTISISPGSPPACPARGHRLRHRAAGPAEPVVPGGPPAGSGNLFPMLGVTALRGRLILPEDDGTDREPVAVLSEESWQERFGGDPAIVGRTIRLDGVSHTVVGILPVASACPTGPRWPGRRSGADALQRGGAVVAEQQLPPRARPPPRGRHTGRRGGGAGPAVRRDRRPEPRPQGGKRARAPAAGRWHRRGASAAPAHLRRGRRSCCSSPR